MPVSIVCKERFVFDLLKKTITDREVWWLLKKTCNFVV